MDAAPKNGEPIDLWCERTNLDGDVSYVRKCSVYWGDVSHQFTHEEYKAWIGIYEQFADIRPVAWREITLPAQPENGGE